MGRIRAAGAPLRDGAPRTRSRERRPDRDRWGQPSRMGHRRTGGAVAQRAAPRPLPGRGRHRTRVSARGLAGSDRRRGGPGAGRQGARDPGCAAPPGAHHLLRSSRAGPLRSARASRVPGRGAPGGRARPREAGRVRRRPGGGPGRPARAPLHDLGDDEQAQARRALALEPAQHGRTTAGCGSDGGGGRVRLVSPARLDRRADDDDLPPRPGRLPRELPRGAGHRAAGSARDRAARDVLAAPHLGEPRLRGAGDGGGHDAAEAPRAGVGHAGGRGGGRRRVRGADAGWLAAPPARDRGDRRDASDQEPARPATPARRLHGRGRARAGRVPLLPRARREPEADLRADGGRRDLGAAPRRGHPLPDGRGAAARDGGPGGGRWGDPHPGSGRLRGVLREPGGDARDAGGRLAAFGRRRVL